MRSFRSTFVATTLIAACVTVMAQSSTPGIDQRGAYQDLRIQEGIANGEINAREAYRLEREQARIDRAESRAKADGHVSTQERARLRQLQTEASRDIARERHDAQTVPGQVAPPAGRTLGIDRREVRQDLRIQQGIDSGQINAREAYRLEKQQARIDSAEARAKADGAVSAQERAQLRHMQTRASRDIRREKHDRQAAPRG